MKLKLTKSMIRIWSLCFAFLFLVVSFFPTQAKKSVNELENDVSEIREKLDNLEENMDDILAEIESISEELESTKEELAIAKGQEEVQYESMKLRIKYLYENGNLSFLEALVSSHSIAELVSRTEFYSAIAEYDRKMLDELLETQETITEKEKTLLERQNYLATLQNELDKKIASTSDELGSLNAKLKQAKDDAKKAEEAAKEEPKPIRPSKPTVKPPSGTTTTNKDPVSATASDIELLAALLECEAGSTNYEAVLAVGSVVVNRMKSPYYPNTLRGVIFQSGQFPPALNGKVDRILARGVKPLCVQAAQDALNGKNNVGDCLSFRASSSGRPGIVIGDNVFF